MRKRFKNKKSFIKFAINRVKTRIIGEYLKDKKWQKENRLELFLNGHRFED